MHIFIFRIWARVGVAMRMLMWMSMRIIVIMWMTVRMTLTLRWTGLTAMRVCMTEACQTNYIHFLCLTKHFFLKGSDKIRLLRFYGAVQGKGPSSMKSWNHGFYSNRSKISGALISHYFHTFSHFLIFSSQNPEYLKNPIFSFRSIQRAHMVKYRIIQILWLRIGNYQINVKNMKVRATNIFGLNQRRFMVSRLD